MDPEVTGRAGGASWPAHCPELGSLSGQLGMMDGPAVPAQDERPWQLAAFLAQGQTPGWLLLPGLCPPSPPHCDSCRGRVGGRPHPRDGAWGHPRAAHPGRQALRPRAGAFWVGWRAQARGCSDHTREVGTGWGCPRDCRWGGRVAIIPVSGAGAKAGRGGEGCGGKDPPTFPTQEAPRTSLSFHRFWGGSRAEPSCPVDSASSGNKRSSKSSAGLRCSG